MKHAIAAFKQRVNGCSSQEEQVLKRVFQVHPAQGRPLLLARGAGIETKGGGGCKRAYSCSSQEEQVLKPEH